jgi:hypothetical protein
MCGHLQQLRIQTLIPFKICDAPMWLTHQRDDSDTRSRANGFGGQVPASTLRETLAETTGNARQQRLAINVWDSSNDI